MTTSFQAHTPELHFICVACTDLVNFATCILQHRSLKARARWYIIEHSFDYLRTNERNAKRKERPSPRRVQ